jgi:hypothetical protein
MVSLSISQDNRKIHDSAAAAKGSHLQVFHSHIKNTVTRPDLARVSYRCSVLMAETHSDTAAGTPHERSPVFRTDPPPPLSLSLSVSHSPAWRARSVCQRLFTLVIQILVVCLRDIARSRSLIALYRHHPYMLTRTKQKKRKQAIENKPRKRKERSAQRREREARGKQLSPHRLDVVPRCSAPPCPEWLPAAHNNNNNNNNKNNTHTHDQWVE